MLRGPPRPTLLPTRRSSDLGAGAFPAVVCSRKARANESQKGKVEGGGGYAAGAGVARSAAGVPRVSRARVYRFSLAARLSGQGGVGVWAPDVSASDVRRPGLRETRALGGLDAGVFQLDDG